MHKCPNNYGIIPNEVFSAAKNNRQDKYKDNVTNRDMARGQISWPIRKGDLLLSDETKVAEKECHFTFLETGNRKFKFSVYEYADDEDVPTRFQIAQNGTQKLLETLTDCR